MRIFVFEGLDVFY